MTHQAKAQPVGAVKKPSHLKQGPRLSRVEEVEVQWAEETGLKGFYVY
nr:hypothetical protein [Thermus scotoductus]